MKDLSKAPFGSSSGQQTKGLSLPVIVNCISGFTKLSGETSHESARRGNSKSFHVFVIFT